MADTANLIIRIVTICSTAVFVHYVLHALYP